MVIGGLPQNVLKQKLNDPNFDVGLFFVSSQVHFSIFVILFFPLVRIDFLGINRTPSWTSSVTTPVRIR